MEIAEALQAAGVLIVQGERAWFSHHLNHDYLVSRFLCADEGRWNSAEFDIVTFRASSFDVLALALQQLESEGSADRFVRRIYDWNPYAAAYAITEGRGEGTSLAVSREMEFAIITMLGLRRWDLIEATRVKAEDALSLFTSGPALAVLSKATRAEILQMAAALQSEKQWFIEWQRLLTERRAVGDADLRLIEDTDSLRGWTFANVLREVELEPRLQNTLREVLRQANSETVRWRVVHVLGAYPTAANAEALLERFANEPPGWVRYGAIRALVEVAALGDPEIRATVFAQLREHLDRLEQDERTQREFEDAIFVDPNRAPADWVETLAGVIEALYEREPSAEKRDRFQELAYRLRGLYGPPRMD